MLATPDPAYCEMSCVGKKTPENLSCPLDCYLPAGWLHQRGDDFRERGFAGAIRPDEAEDFALVNVERHVAHRFDRRLEFTTKKFFQTKEGNRIGLRQIGDRHRDRPSTVRMTAGRDLAKTLSCRHS